MGKYENLVNEEQSQPSTGSPTTPYGNNSNVGHLPAQPVYNNIYTSSAGSPAGLSTPRTLNAASRELYEPQKFGWFVDLLRNNPQSKSLFVAIFIFGAAGMSLAYSVSFAPGYAIHNEIALKHLEICWFIAVIIGATLSAVFMDKFTKRSIYLVASVLVIASGLLFILFPTTTLATAIARYCNGIAFGLTVVQTIVVASERSVKRFRGLVLSIEQTSLAVGMLIYLHFCSGRSKQLYAILTIVYGAAALLFNFVYTTESPVAYLRKGNETEAVNVLRKLQRPFVVTAETYELLNENKLLLNEDIARGRSVNVSNGLIPLVKLCLFRAFVSMSFSAPITFAFDLSAMLMHSYDDLSQLYICAVMRLIGTVIAKVVTLDNIGRKGVTALSLFVGGGLLIGVGAIYATHGNDTDPEALYTAKGLLLAYQLFAGLAAPASTCYLGEAFSISVKRYFILVAIVVENIVQVIICCTFHARAVSDFGYALGILQLAFAVYFLFGMPETKQTTLREALAKFARK